MDTVPGTIAGVVLGGPGYLLRREEFRRQQAERQSRNEALTTLTGLLAPQSRSFALPAYGESVTTVPPLERAEHELGTTGPRYPAETRSYTGVPTISDALGRLAGTTGGSTEARSLALQFLLGAGLPTEAPPPADLEREATRRSLVNERLAAGFTPERAEAEANAYVATGGRTGLSAPERPQRYVTGDRLITVPPQGSATAEAIPGMPQPAPQRYYDAQSRGVVTIPSQGPPAFEAVPGLPTDPARPLYPPHVRDETDGEGNVRRIITPYDAEGRPGAPVVQNLGKVGKPQREPRGPTPTTSTTEKRTPRRRITDTAQLSRVQETLNGAVNEMAGANPSFADAKSSTVTLRSGRKIAKDVAIREYVRERYGVEVAVRWNGRKWVVTNAWEPSQLLESTTTRGPARLGGPEDE